MSKLKESIELIKLLRIDFYMALFMFGYGVYQVPIVEFVQDKICLNQLGKDTESCRSLNSGDVALADLQSQVITAATSMRNYQTLVSTIPGVIQSFFFGYWIDKYPSHIRLLLVAPCVGMFIQSTSLIYQCINFKIPIENSLWSFLAMGLGGGQSLALAASFTYAAKKTPQKYRSIRFAIVDLFIFTAFPLGVAAGGKILAAKPWFGGEERNFTGVFTASAISMIIGIIWAIVFINDSGPRERKPSAEANGTNGNPSSPASEAATSMTEIDLTDNGPQTSAKETKQTAWAIAADIFNLANVYKTFKTFFRKRDNNDRLKVVLLSFSVLIVFVSLLGESMFGFQYTEKEFLWNSEKYSEIAALVTIAQSLGTVIGSTLLKNVAKLEDAEVAALGTLSHFLGNLIRGIPTVTTYIAGSLTFCLAGIAIPATRSVLTQIIDFNEIGQILAIIACFQAVGPLVASVITTAVFEATIDSAPSTAYHVLSALVIPPLIVQVWVSCIKESKEKKPTPEVKFIRKSDIVRIEEPSRPQDTEKF
ncbi:uncharacterized protein LOC107362807 [Tetranychus urticae]|uniref:Major facilitator superfamily (MFS) profile domain-containing protein n=1 Tax=Tetranychus urticae TaxID=32264 RepID=T1KAI2_TETUR|nr:uncharacterized protein LOC107362807 [Tetranychus urticae]